MVASPERFSAPMFLSISTEELCGSCTKPQVDGDLQNCERCNEALVSEDYWHDHCHGGSYADCCLDRNSMAWARIEAEALKQEDLDFNVIPSHGKQTALCISETANKHQSSTPLIPSTSNAIITAYMQTTSNSLSSFATKESQSAKPDLTS
jgi:hypothetical protein